MHTIEVEVQVYVRQQQSAHKKGQIDCLTFEISGSLCFYINGTNALGISITRFTRHQVKLDTASFCWRGIATIYKSMDVQGCG